MHALQVLLSQTLTTTATCSVADHCACTSYITARIRLQELLETVDSLGLMAMSYASVNTRGLIAAPHSMPDRERLDALWNIVVQVSFSHFNTSIIRVHNHISVLVANSAILCCRCHRRGYAYFTELYYCVAVAAADARVSTLIFWHQEQQSANTINCLQRNTLLTFMQTMYPMAFTLLLLLRTGAAESEAVTSSNRPHRYHYW